MRIPLYGSYVNRNSNPSASSGKDQIFINCYPQIAKNELARSATVFLNKRPGFAATVGPGSGYAASRGVIFWTGAATTSYPIFSFQSTGAAVVQIWDSNGPTQVGGNIATAGSPFCESLTETLISGTPNLVARVNDGATQEAWFFPEGGAWTQIADADYPGAAGFTTVGEPAHMDGRMHIMCSDGKIFESDVNSLANWTATNFVTAQSMPDGGVGLARIKNTIVAFGKYSIEFFQNTGNTSGSVLSPIGNTVRRVGADTGAGPLNRTILTVGDAVYFIGIDSDSRAVGIYKLTGVGDPEKISTPFIDALLKENGAACLRGVIELHGMTHLVTNVVYASGRLLICLDSLFPWFLIIGASSAHFIQAAIANQFTLESNVTYPRSIFKSSTSSPLYQDDSVAYTMTVRLGGSDDGTSNRKTSGPIDLIADKQASGTTTYSRSVDDGASFTDIGTFDMTANVKRITKGGTWKGEAQHRLTHSANTPWRGKYLDLPTTKGVT